MSKLFFNLPMYQLDYLLDPQGFIPERHQANSQPVSVHVCVELGLFSPIHIKSIEFQLPSHAVVASSHKVLLQLSAAGPCLHYSVP